MNTTKRNEFVGSLSSVQCLFFLVFLLRIRAAAFIHNTLHIHEYVTKLLTQCSCCSHLIKRKMTLYQLHCLIDMHPEHSLLTDTDSLNG